MRPSPWPRRRPSGDDGFSLVEAVVALAIASVVFTALAFALIGGAKAGLLSQQNQQAGDVLNQAVEKARSLSYGALSMRAADLDVGDTRTPALSSSLCYNPTDDSTVVGAGCEQLWPRDANGGIHPHVTTVDQNGRTFTVRRYVTVPSDAAGVYKRLTVVVTWDGLGKERKRTYSTLVADAKRGLPLPDFKYNAVGSLSQCRNPGSSLTFSFTVQNNGARDAWALSPVTGPPDWTYYEDTDDSGSFDVLLDAPLPVTAGVPSTGLIEPTTSREFFAVTSLQTAVERPAPYTLTTVFRATSVAQPDYWQELTATTTVQDTACGAVTVSPSPSPSPTSTLPAAPTQPEPSCASLTGPVATSAPNGTMVRYYPVNATAPGNTLALADMPMQRDAGAPPAAGDLYNYSTDLHSVAGRHQQIGTTTSTAAAQVATWTYAMPSTSKLEGKGEVTFWARPADGDLNATPTFYVYLDLLRSNGSYDRTLGSATYSAPLGWGCTGFRPTSIPMVDVATGSSVEVKANRLLRLRVVTTSGSPIVLAYGTEAYPMTLTLPYREGLG